MTKSTILYRLTRPCANKTASCVRKKEFFCGRWNILNGCDVITLPQATVLGTHCNAGSLWIRCAHSVFNVGWISRLVFDKNVAVRIGTVVLFLSLAVFRVGMCCVMCLSLNEHWLLCTLDFPGPCPIPSSLCK